MGAGGLGCPAALYLAAAGVGKLVIVDKDNVELNNLNRQILHWSDDVGKEKSFSAAEKLKQLNTEIQVIALKTEITKENCRELVKECSVVVDGMDNWKTRFIVNEVCVQEQVPFVHAGVYALYGQITTIVPGKSPCLKCIIKKKPAETRELPVLGTTPGIIGLLEALETIKLITRIGKPLIGRILSFDGEDLTFKIVQIKKNPKCQVCGIL